ncbi:hypothetical protein [Hymenobacter sp. B81]|uniref:DUF922 domain-containing protein n=1 Tax=Hymenobacter sp. B81 TaxID=3344878 RepID=UPI0037DC6863
MPAFHLLRLFLRPLFLGVFGAVALAACAPAVKLQSTQRLPPIAAQEAFLVLKEGEVFDVQGQELGDIRIKDTGFTLSCNYDKVVALAVTRARQMGANVLWIYEHRLPSTRSTCHQIRAKAMRVPDVTVYEKEIVWTPERRLKQSDFKASTKNRPFAAATNSSMRYRYDATLFGPVNVRIETYFDCGTSYFKPSEQARTLLAHEQLHFDITELFARRLARQLQQEVSTVQEFEQKHEAIMRQVSLEWHAMQDQYDSEVYADPNKQPGWQQRVAQDMNALQDYAHKSLQLSR